MCNAMCKQQFVKCEKSGIFFSRLELHFNTTLKKLNTYTDYGSMQCFFLNNLNTFCKEFCTCKM